MPGFLYFENSKRINTLKRVFILISFLCGIAYSQPVFEVPLLSDLTVIPGDSVSNIYYSYRIPINSFVFVKESSVYSADYRITVEVRDSSSTFFSRQISENKITALTFDETNAKDSYEEGLLTFRLKPGTYFFTPILFDLNSNHEYRVHHLKAVLKNDDKEYFLSPVVVNKKGNHLKNVFTLTNYGGEIPFSENDYNLIIPCSDTSLKNIDVTFINNEDTTLYKNLSDSFVSCMSIASNKGDVFVESKTGIKPTRNFFLADFSRKLMEGDLEIIIRSAGDKSFKKTFHKKVIWFDKPFSLRDPERAIRLLAVVNKKDIVDSLLSGSSKKYERNLFEYWKRFDPTKNSDYNPLMAEYYNRVDYALKHFYTISRKREFLTDMSKIYIKYGKPVEIKRTYNQYGKSIETWIYNNPANIFDFIDPDGTGNFMLVKKG